MLMNRRNGECVRAITCSGCRAYFLSNKNRKKNFFLCQNADFDREWCRQVTGVSLWNAYNYVPKTGKYVFSCALRPWKTVCECAFVLQPTWWLNVNSRTPFEGFTRLFQCLYAPKVWYCVIQLKARWSGCIHEHVQLIRAHCTLLHPLWT